MQIVSSKWTLSLKLLLPTFWFSFFVGSLMILIFTDLTNIGAPFTPFTARLTMLSFVFSSAASYYLFFLPIKWVAMDEDFIYVSNFFKSAKYTYDSINGFEESKFLLWNKVSIQFHNKGIFGQNIIFFRSYYWLYFLKKHPAVLEKLINE